MTSPLEKLRAIARNTLPYYELNERNEITPPQPPPEKILSFNSFLSLPENAASAAERATPKSWAEGFAALCVMPAPTGFSAQRWQRIVDAAGMFLDRWADTAIACGWTDLDVFGCNPDRPDARFDCMGLVLLLDRCEVVGIDEAGADLVMNTGACQRFRRRPPSAGHHQLVGADPMTPARSHGAAIAIMGSNNGGRVPTCPTASRRPHNGVDIK
jgi:hypothetical protein